MNIRRNRRGISLGITAAIGILLFLLVFGSYAGIISSFDPVETVKKTAQRALDPGNWLPWGGGDGVIDDGTEDGEGEGDGGPSDGNGENSPPTTDAGGPYSGNVGESIELDGTGSSDSDGSISSYDWDLDNDGSYDDATGSTPTHSWSSSGTYTVGLKVTDNDGVTDTDSVEVSISSGDGSTEAEFTLVEVTGIPEDSIIIDVSGFRGEDCAKVLTQDSNYELNLNGNSVKFSPLHSNCETVLLMLEKKNIKKDEDSFTVTGKNALEGECKYSPEDTLPVSCS